MSPIKDDKYLEVAMAGGGIAAMCFAYGLAKNPRLHVQIYEARQNPGDDGQAFGIGSNAKKALQLLDLALRDAIGKAGGFQTATSARVMLASQDAKEGQWVADNGHDPPQIIVGRGAFKRELQKAIPETEIHAGQRIARVEENHDATGASEVRICMADGSSFLVDAVIGCDGVNSVVRQAVLLPEYPDAVKSFRTGMYHTRTVVPIEHGIEAFGEDYMGLKMQRAWIGEGFAVLTDRFDEGRKIQLITSWGVKGERKWDSEEDWGVLDNDRLQADLEQEFGEFGKKVWKAHKSVSQVNAGADKYHPDTPTYFKGHMCLLGDAAQTISPAQGAGAGQAIEDVLALSTVLAGTRSSGELHQAFKVYDRIRRPRKSDVAKSSAAASGFMHGRLEGVDLDIDKMRKVLSASGDNIHHYDVEKTVEELKEAMH